MLSIQLLGTPQIALDGRAVSVSRRKSRALLYYLAAQRGPVSRDQLLGLLWPDHDRSAGQQVLRTTLYGLRKELGASLQIADELLSIDPSAAIDVRRFEQQLDPPASSPAALSGALALYRGEFLAGFSLADSDEFERWAAGARERYRQLALRGFSALAQQHEQLHDYHAASAALAQALALNPLQEDLQRAAMRLDYLAGDRAGAIRRYEQLRRLLDDELGVPPMDETRALYDAIITDTLPAADDRPPASALARPSQAASERWPAPAATSPSVLPFTGRAAELAALRQAAGAHRLALIEGEPGIGKTRLAEAFLAEHGGIALIGAARELEQALPYQPVIEALRGLLRRPEWPALARELALPALWLGELGRLLPELQAGAGPGLADPILPGSAESRLWEAVNQLLLALARQRPVVLLLDDLHWSDTATLALLGYLVRQSTAAPLAFLATGRPAAPRSPVAALLQTLTREDRLLRLPLARLQASDTLALAQHFSPTFAYPLADWLARNADGNPYIMSELVRYAHEHGILQANGVVNLAAISESPVVPRGVYSLIQSRLAGLSDSARRVLDVAVAIGREFELDVVAQATSLPEAALLDGLDELCASHLIVPLDGLRYSFDHPLTMEVAFREVGEARHRVIHRNVAEAIERVHQSQLADYAGLLASHFAEGNAAERAARYAFMAGRRAADLAAWSEAIAFYQQALTGADTGQRAAIFLAIGEIHTRSGLAAQASETLRSAIELAEANGDAALADRARLGLGMALISQARYAEAITIARQILERGAAEFQVDAELIWSTALSVEGVDLDGAALRLQSAAKLCAAGSDPQHLAHIKFELGSIAAQQGELPAAVGYYREALAIAETAPAAMQYQILALNNLAYHLMLMGDPSAGNYAEAGLTLAREQGMPNFQAYLHSTQGEIALAAGDLDAAERAFSTGLDLAERLSIHERIAGLTANLGLVARERGAAALAIHRLSTALAQADGLGTRHLAALIRTWLAPLLPAAEARATLAEARAIAESGGRRQLLETIAQLERDLRA